jgi:hypothetical protein
MRTDDGVEGRSGGGGTATAVARDEAVAAGQQAPRAGTPPGGTGAARRAAGHDSLLTQVRASDIEPYTGLRYLSKLFRLMAVILVLLLIAEVVTGVVTQGTASIPVLLPEASKLIVAAALLWASGDLAILLIDIGHDVRAARILLGRQVAHHIAEQRPTTPAEGTEAPAAPPAGASTPGAR